MCQRCDRWGAGSTFGADERHRAAFHGSGKSQPDECCIYWASILRWFHAGLNNGIMEGLNSLIQVAKRKARGYRQHDIFRRIAFLIAGKLDLRLPTLH
jgi:hypothetical protein